MKFNRNQAKALSNSRELELYDSARPPQLNKLTVAELKRKVKSSRTLRDKLRDVKRGQVRSAQAKSKGRGAVPADRSREKADLFAEVHDVFVARLAKLEAGEAKAKPTKAVKKSGKADKKIKTRAERTGTRQKLKAVKRSTDRPAKPAAKAKTSGTATAKAEKAKAKKPLASAARVSKAAPAKNRAAARSPKATSASKAAMHPEVDEALSLQAAARKAVSAGKVEQARIARSGITRQRAHLSGVNKRRQGKRDSRKG